MNPRPGKPYVWVSWITGLISGDANCEWSSWVKAHFYYNEHPDAAGNDLSVWKAEHAALVRQRADELVAQGWKVRVEDQNKFSLKGRVAVLGGKPDIAATRRSLTNPGSALAPNVDGLIVDCKTGRPKESDYWQVITYMTMGPLAGILAGCAEIRGEVCYKDSKRLVSPLDAANGAPHVASRIEAVGQAHEPKRTPSASECRFCKVGECPERVDTPDAVGETESF